jgi:hypothetical protein
MSGDRLAVCTTFYPGCAPFVPAWYESLCQQSDLGFDLWIAIDGMTPAEARDLISGPIAARWVPGASGDTPAAVRQRLFALVVKQYDTIVLVDADDLLGPSRIASARAALQDVDLAGCALRLVDHCGVDLGRTFGPAVGTDLSLLLPRCNVFGLSNSAYRAATLARCLPVPHGCVLIDWLLASRALATGATLGFDEVPKMAYRQHRHNVAPVLPPFTAARVRAAATRVVAHYHHLLNGDWAWPPGSRQPFVHACRRAEAFQRAILDSPRTLARYCAYLNRLTPQYIWWWAVAHPNLEHLWSR